MPGPTATALVAAGQLGPSLVVRHSCHPHPCQGSPIRWSASVIQNSYLNIYTLYGYLVNPRPVGGCLLARDGRWSLRVWAWTSSESRPTSTHFWTARWSATIGVSRGIGGQRRGRELPRIAVSAQRAVPVPLAGAIQARRVLEVGTRWHSTTARGAGPGDRWSRWNTSPTRWGFAWVNLQRAGVADQVEVVVGPALGVRGVGKWPVRPEVFIDADKENNVCIYSVGDPVGPARHGDRGGQRYSWRRVRAGPTCRHSGGTSGAANDGWHLPA